MGLDGSQKYLKCELTVVVATGIGNGVAVDLAMKGWKVVILDHNAKSGEAVALESNGDFYQTDVRSWKQQHDAFEATIGKYGRVDFGNFQSRVCREIGINCMKSTRQRGNTREAGLL